MRLALLFVHLQVQLVFGPYRAVGQTPRFTWGYDLVKNKGVTYPTVRLRLDRLIQKITISEDREKDPYIAVIKRLALNDKLDFDTAKILINEYKKQKER